MPTIEEARIIGGKQGTLSGPLKRERRDETVSPRLRYAHARLPPITDDIKRRHEVTPFA